MTPLSDEPYAPPPPDELQFGPVTTRPPRPKRTGLIVGLVVAVVLLCCCTVFGGLFAFGFISGLEDASVDPGTPSFDPAPIAPPAGGAVSPADEASRVATWDAWEPALGEDASVDPDARQERIAREVAAAILPGFVLDEIRVKPGSYDEAADTYWADYYLVRLHQGSDSDTVIGYSFWAASEEWAAEGVEWDTSGFYGTEVLDTLADGTEYAYDTIAFEPLVGSVPTPVEFDALLPIISSDWPGAVITWVGWSVDSDDGERWAIVYLTTWDQFVDERAFDGWEASYVHDGAWNLINWELYDEVE